jgi:hypothetical protein
MNQALYAHMNNKRKMKKKDFPLGRTSYSYHHLIKKWTKD